MQRGLEGVVATGETVLSGDKEVSVLKMEGDEFMLLIHKLAAFNEMQDVMRPEAWDHYEGEEKNRTTRISTSAISNESLVLADSKAIYGPRKILYGYSEIPPDGFRFSSGNDLWTLQTGMPHRQDYFYKSPKDVIKNMLDVSDNQQDLSPPHNEVVIGGESESGGRLPPNYIVVFGKNKSDIHFGPVPILLIDPDKYGKREK